MRKKIGIITGSGPEAGIDLWQKILKVNKDILGEKFRGDLDAPDLTILSVPQLGHSMELEQNYDMVWDTLKHTAFSMCEQVDYFVIACNTLNVYANKFHQVGIGDKFISTLDVVNEYMQDHKLQDACIIGALPVLEMKEYSVFTPLKDIYNIELPKDFKKVHQLIYDVKRFSGYDKRVVNEFQNIINEIDSNDIFLACTELPLIKIRQKEKNLIDVTDLLAKKLVEKSL